MTNTETLEDLTNKLLAEKFSGDAGKYSEAFALAASQRPDLAEEYKHRPAVK